MEADLMIDPRRPRSSKNDPPHTESPVNISSL